MRTSRTVRAWAVYLPCRLALPCAPSTRPACGVAVNARASQEPSATGFVPLSLGRRNRATVTASETEVGNITQFAAWTSLTVQEWRLA